jgi:hypothetical protein
MKKEISDRSHRISFFTRIEIGISKFFGLIPVYGIRGALSQIIKNLFWFEITYRFRKDLTVIEENKIQAKIPIEIVVFGPELDLELWRDNQRITNIRGDYGLKQFRDRFSEGDLLFCAYSQDKFTGFIWLNPPNYSFSGITLHPDENYHIDGWVFEEYRGNNILPVLQQAVIDYLRKERPYIHYLVSHGALKNKATLSGQQKAGMIPVARELSIFLLGYNKKIKLNDVHSPVS